MQVQKQFHYAFLQKASALEYGCCKHFIPSAVSCRNQKPVPSVKSGLEINVFLKFFDCSVS